MMYYSKTTNGFYDSTIHNGLPDDSVEISISTWQSLLNSQSNGKQISCDSNGIPIAVDPPVVPLTPSQEANLALSSGYTITFAQTPSLSGLYNCNTTAQQNITSTFMYIQINNKFPGSSGTLTWYDRNNGPHTFTTIDQFHSFATAIADYIAELTQIVMSEQGTLPPNSIVINQ